MSGLPSGCGAVSNVGRRRIDVRRVDPEAGGVLRRLRRLDGGVGGLADLAIDVLGDLGQLVVGDEVLRFQKRGELRNRIALGLVGTLRRRLVEPLVVRERVRVRTDARRVHQRRSFARAAPGRRVLHRAIALEHVGAVAAKDVEAGERLDELGDAAAGRLHLDGHRDRVAVVLDHEEHGQFADARGRQRLPELALAGRAVADRDVDDLVVLELRVAIGNVLDALVEHAGFGAADGLQALRAGRARLRDDVELLVAPVRRHLPAAAVRIVLGADAAQEHLERRHAEHQAQRAVAVVRIEPVVRRLEHQAGGGHDRLVAGAADLEEDQALVLELDFLVVDAPRQQHRPVELHELVAGETFEGPFGAGPRRFRRAFRGSGVRDGCVSHAWVRCQEFRGPGNRSIILLSNFAR